MTSICFKWVGSTTNYYRSVFFSNKCEEFSPKFQGLEPENHTISTFVSSKPPNLQVPTLAGGVRLILYIFILYIIYIYINPSVENCQDLATWEVVAHAEALRFACLQNLGRPRAATELRQRTTQRSFVKLKS